MAALAVTIARMATSRIRIVRTAITGIDRTVIVRIMAGRAIMATTVGPLVTGRMENRTAIALTDMWFAWVAV